MSPGKRIKTQWASLALNDEGRVVVCVNENSHRKHFCFDSLTHLETALDHRELIVGKWIVPLPVQCCILKTVTLPASDLEEAAKMIEFELPDLVPMPGDQLSYGCSVLNKHQNMLDVLVCLARTNDIEQHLESFAEIGIKPHFVYADSFAVWNWIACKEQQTPSPWIAALLSDRNAIVVSSVNDNLQQANEINASTSSALIDKLVQQIVNQDKSMTGSTDSASHILLVGSDGLVHELKDRLQDMFEPAILELPAVIHYGNGDHNDTANLCLAGTIAAGLFDIAAKKRLLHCNLLPSKYLESARRKTLVLNYSFSAITALLAVLLLWLSLWASNRRIDQKTNLIQARIAPIVDIADSVESKRRQVKAIGAQLYGRGMITNILAELFKYTPRNVSIFRFQLTTGSGGANIEISGQADALANAFGYAEAMRKGKILNQMQILNAQQIPRPGGSVVEFKARCTITSERINDP
ncbi:MAG: pilus assembly protein PilM [Planctomycetota bacterium]